MAEANHENHWNGAGVGCEDIIGGRLRSRCQAGVVTAIVPVGSSPSTRFGQAAPLVCIQGMLQRDDGKPLGTPASVQQSLRVVFPEVAFDWSPTGREKLASLDARGIALPEMVRRALELQPSFVCGHVASDTYEVSFNLGTGGPVERIWVQVNRGVAQVSHCWEILSMNTGWELNLEGG